MDFEKICRICCEQKQRMRPLLASASSGSADPVQQFYRDFLSLEISADDGLPQNVCRPCIKALATLQKTIDEIRANDSMLRKQLAGAGSESSMVLEEIVFDTLQNGVATEVEIEMIVTTTEDDQQINILESFEELLRAGDDDLDWAQSENSNSMSDTEDEPKPSTKKQRKSPNGRGKRRGRPKTKADKTPSVRPRKNDFKCYICKSESFGSGDAMLAHLHSHTSELPYTCGICVQETVTINSVTTLNVHKRMHENPLKCDLCDRRYSNQRALALHKNIQHSGENDPCPSTCGHCGKVCPTKLALRNHEKFHTHGIKCEFCGKVFVENNKLRAHIQRKHEKLKNYQCHLCQKRLTSLDAVQSHIKFMHSDREKLKCKYCDRRYISEYSLRTHERKHATDETYKATNKWTDYYTVVPGEDGTPGKKCNLCGAVVRAIGAHLIALHFPSEHRCELCDAVFKRRKIYELHLAEHERGKAHSCPICDRKFSERKLLITHLRTKQHQDDPAAQLYLSQTRTRYEKHRRTEMVAKPLDEVDIRADALLM